MSDVGDRESFHDEDDDGDEFHPNPYLYLPFVLKLQQVLQVHLHPLHINPHKLSRHLQLVFMSKTPGEWNVPPQIRPPAPVEGKWTVHSSVGSGAVHQYSGKIQCIRCYVPKQSGWIILTSRTPFSWSLVAAYFTAAFVLTFRPLIWLSVINAIDL